MRTLTFLALLAAGCGSKNIQTLELPRLERPRAGAAFHTQLTLTPRWPGTSGGVERPETLRGVLTLDGDAAASGRVTGSIAMFSFDVLRASGPSTTSLAQVAGTFANGALTLEAGTVAASPGGTFTWSAFTLEAGGEGTVRGHWSRVLGDVVDQTDFEASVDWAADTSGELARLTVVGDRPAPDLLPTDVLRVTFDEPVLETQARSSVKLLADGAEVAADGSSTSGGVVNGRVTSLLLRPQHALPFGATLSLAPHGLADPAGNALVAGASRHVVADPGAATDNPGFENGSARWVTVGNVAVGGAFQGLAPAEGAAQLVVHEESLASGYLDVPATATELQLAVALFSEQGQFDAGRTAVVRLVSEGAPDVVLFDAAAERARDASCDCGQLGHRIARQVKTADVTALRGKRAFVVAEVRSAFFIGVNYYALVLDDLRVH
ncbi:MAG: hypothetical protein IPJ65_26685 [Archangiaceae bacterium]|nr:hypothetical protein [Archangiaceae bacterium]